MNALNRNSEFAIIAQYPPTSCPFSDLTTTSLLSCSSTHQKWLTLCLLHVLHLSSPPSMSISLSLPLLPFLLLLSSREKNWKNSASNGPVSRARKSINIGGKLNKNKSPCHSVLSIFMFPKLPLQIFHHNFHSRSYFHLVGILGLRSFTNRATETWKS